MDEEPRPGSATTDVSEGFSGPPTDTGATSTAPPPPHTGAHQGSARPGRSGQPAGDDRADALREVYALRREAEQQRGEASRARERAAAQAEAMVGRAQALAAALVEEARAEAEMIVLRSRTGGEALARSRVEEAGDLTDALSQVHAALDDLRESLVDGLDSLDRVDAGLTRLEALAAARRAGPDPPAPDRRATDPAGAGAAPTWAASAPTAAQGPGARDRPVAPDPASPGDDVEMSGPVPIVTQPPRRHAWRPHHRPGPDAPEDEPPAPEGRPAGWPFRASTR